MPPHSKVQAKKEAFLKGFAPSLSLKANCDRFGMVRKTLYNWRRNDKDFEARLSKIIEEYNEGHKAAPPPPTHITVPTVEGDWKSQFLAAYVPCFGNMTQCALTAEVDLVIAMRALTPPGQKGHDARHFDAEFAAQVAELDPVVEQALEDRVRYGSVHGKATNDLRWLLQSRRPDKYGPRAVARTSDAKDRVVPSMSEDLFDKFIDTLRQARTA